MSAAEILLEHRHGEKVKRHMRLPHRSRFVRDWLFAKS